MGLGGTIYSPLPILALLFGFFCLLCISLLVINFITVGGGMFWVLATDNITLVVKVES